MIVRPDVRIDPPPGNAVIAGAHRTTLHLRCALAFIFQLRLQIDRQQHILRPAAIEVAEDHVAVIDRRFVVVEE